jgi:NAD(P)-dependent dehydrogenase (short-subunit alcohol dehydrogenase family)
VLLDLADPDSIGPACRQVLERADGNLAGVVNNAGMSINGPFESISVASWREQFEVNLFGHIAVTAGLLPALLDNGGRIVTVGSIGGRMALPFLAPYTSSKFAIRGWMDAIRHELAPHGVHAVLVEPGAIATPFWGKGNDQVDELLADLSEEQRERYAEQIRNARKAARLSERHAIPPERCAAVIERAMTARRPAGRYLVGPDARVQATVAAMPTRVLDATVRLVVRQ